MGTALFSNVKLLNNCLKKSGTNIVTVAIRRLDLANKENFF